MLDSKVAGHGGAKVSPPPPPPPPPTLLLLPFISTFLCYSFDLYSQPPLFFVQVVVVVSKQGVVECWCAGVEGTK